MITTIKDLVALLQTIPDGMPLADVDTDEDGDLKLEWYFDQNNIILLTIPTDGTTPYISKFLKRESSTEYDLHLFSKLIIEADLNFSANNH